MPGNSERNDPIVQLQYLGTAGWHLSVEGCGLLFDPYFTRVPLRRLAFGRIAPSPAAVQRHTPPAGWVVVSHAHFDHLLDVPEVARMSGATVYAPRQSCELLGVLGVPPEQVCAIVPGDQLPLGPFAVEVYEVPHRVILGRVPAQGPLRAGLRPPLRARDYRFRELFSFRVEVGGMQVLIASGIEREPPVPADVLLVGADASREQLTRILGATQPRLVLPNHFDDIFRPLSKPARPSLHPLPGIALPRRLDLGAWASLVSRLASRARVLIPERFTAYDLGELLR